MAYRKVASPPMRPGMLKNAIGVFALMFSGAFGRRLPDDQDETSAASREQSTASSAAEDDPSGTGAGSTNSPASFAGLLGEPEAVGATNNGVSYGTIASTIMNFIAAEMERQTSSSENPNSAIVDGGSCDASSQVGSDESDPMDYFFFVFSHQQTETGNPGDEAYPDSSTGVSETGSSPDR
jgi:hypothetical protein